MGKLLRYDLESWELFYDSIDAGETNKAASELSGIAPARAGTAAAKFRKIKKERAAAGQPPPTAAELHPRAPRQADAPTPPAPQTPDTETPAVDTLTANQNVLQGDSGGSVGGLTGTDVFRSDEVIEGILGGLAELTALHQRLQGQVDEVQKSIEVGLRGIRIDVRDLKDSQKRLNGSGYTDNGNHRTTYRSDAAYEQDDYEREAEQTAIEAFSGMTAADEFDYE